MVHQRPLFQSYSIDFQLHSYKVTSMQISVECRNDSNASHLCMLQEQAELIAHMV